MAEYGLVPDLLSSIILSNFICSKGTSTSYGVPLSIFCGLTSSSPNISLNCS